MSSRSWMGRAACLSADPGAFFADCGDSAAVRAAKQVCAGCEVRPECLAYALALGVREGVFGGLSPDERRALARAGRPAPAAAQAA